MRFDEPVEAIARPLALLHDDAVQLRVLRGELDELPHHQSRDRDVVDAPQAGEPLLHGRAEPVEEIVDRRAPQVRLAGEVVVEQRLGDPRELGDRPGRRTVEAAFGEQVQGGVEDRAAGLAASGRGEDDHASTLSTDQVEVNILIVR